MDDTVGRVREINLHEAARILRPDRPALAMAIDSARLALARVREVREQMLSDGYHRPNELILILDAVLGEDYDV